MHKGRFVDEHVQDYWLEFCMCGGGGYDNELSC